MSSYFCSVLNSRSASLKALNNWTNFNPQCLQTHTKMLTNSTAAAGAAHFYGQSNWFHPISTFFASFTWHTSVETSIKLLTLQFFSASSSSSTLVLSHFRSVRYTISTWNEMAKILPLRWSFVNVSKVMVWPHAVLNDRIMFYAFSLMHSLASNYDVHLNFPKRPHLLKIAQRHSHKCTPQHRQWDWHVPDRLSAALCPTQTHRDTSIFYYILLKMLKW